MGRRALLPNVDSREIDFELIGRGNGVFGVSIDDDAFDRMTPDM
jgi:hypothetical protein